MSESEDLLDEIRKTIKGKTLLVGRKIGQEKFDAFSAVLRVEAKPQKYPTGGNIIPWTTGLLDKFTTGDFDSILLHRFLYKRVKEYIEDPTTVLTEVKRILPEGGVLVVNSFLLDDVTKNFRSVDSFFTAEEMQGILGAQDFKKISRIRYGNVTTFVCEK